MGKPEGIIENYLVKQARLKNYACYKFKSPGNKGVPDRILIAKGITIYIECKNPMGKLSNIQKVVISQLCKQGVIVKVVSSKEEVDEIFNFLESKPKKRATPLPFV